MDLQIDCQGHWKNDEEKGWEVYIVFVFSLLHSI